MRLGGGGVIPALLVPYIIIAVMGGGTTLNAVSGGAVPYWLGGAVVAIVVMSYVFFGGMRGTAWVNTFQTVLFLVFGVGALLLIGSRIGGCLQAMERLLDSETTAALLTRERVSPQFFFSYTFIPLSTIVFPHIIIIFCFTARRMAQFKKTVVYYPLCILAIWLPCVFLGVAANAMLDVPGIVAKLDARALLASGGALSAGMAPDLQQAAAGDDVIILMLEHYAPLWMTGLLGPGLRYCAPGLRRHLQSGGAVCVLRLRGTFPTARGCPLLEGQHQMGGARCDRLDDGDRRCRRVVSGDRAADRSGDGRVVLDRGRCRRDHADTGRYGRPRVYAGGSDDGRIGTPHGCRIVTDTPSERGDPGAILLRTSTTAVRPIGPCV